MKPLPPPYIIIRQWLQNPHAITVAAFIIAGVSIGFSGYFTHRDLCYNEAGLCAPLALSLALIISAAGTFGSLRLSS